VSNVRLALSRLGQKVNNWEGSMEHLEIKLAGEQRDMFAAPDVANGNDIDKDTVAQKLDTAIETIEGMLDETSGEAAHG
jgi:hypothetical protein